MPLTSTKTKKYTGPFMRLASIGSMIDGKIVIDVEYNKVYLTPDEKYPLSTFMIPIMEKLLNHVSWDNPDIGREDFNKIKEFLDNLEPNEGANER